MSKQIRFRDIENNTVQGGILLDNGDVICGCCGGLFEASEQNVTWDLLGEYDTWKDLTHTICGDDCDHADTMTMQRHVPERISRDIVRRGLTDGDIQIGENQDGDVVAVIGDYWFYFGGDCEGVTASVHIDTTDFEDDVEAIWETVNSEPINGPTEEEAKECLYYKAYLAEMAAEKDAMFAGKEWDYTEREQIAACYKYLNWTDSHKDPAEMSEAELLAAKEELAECVPGISWVRHAGYVQAVPQDKHNGFLILA